MTGAGEEDGRGGVVIASSRPLPCPNKLEENKDRRGVANCGLFLVSTHTLCLAQVKEVTESMTKKKE
jgi:hypothetical protein